MTIAVACGLFSFAMSLWQLSRPEFLGLYDSGVYLAAAIHFTAGVLPYRDFTFVQPPGIVLLMSPVAVFSRVLGSHDGLILARIVTSFVAALNTVMLAWLLRHRGRMAMLMAGMGLALLPITSEVTSVLLLEPYCIFFVLLGALVILGASPARGRVSSWRLFLGGALVGVGGLVKIWAIAPFVALSLVVAWRHRRKVWIFMAGSAASFAVLAAPFFFLSPGNFMSQVFVEQLNRQGYWGDNLGVLGRLIGLTGFSTSNFAPSSVEAIVGFVVLAGVVVAAFSVRRDLHDTDAFFLLAAVFSAFLLLSAPIFYPHYPYFSIPFLLGLTAVALARVGGMLKPLRRKVPMTDVVRRFARIAAAFAGVIFLVAMVLWDTTFYTEFADGDSSYVPILNQIPRFIPEGSCVIYDNIGFGVYENRFLSTSPTCPVVVDPIGIRLAWGNEVTRPKAAVVVQWETYFSEAQFVVLDSPIISTLPSSRGISKWLNAHFHVVFRSDYLQIYQLDSS